MTATWDQLEQVFQQADGQARQFTILPTGKYQARITKFTFDANKWTFERMFEVLSGQYQGKTVNDWLHLLDKNNNLNEIGVDRLKQEMIALDPDIANLPLRDSIPVFLQSVQNQVVNIYASTKEGTRPDGGPITYSSIYINEFVTPSGSPAAPGVAPLGVPAGNVPF